MMPPIDGAVSGSRSVERNSLLLIGGFALAKLLIHLATNAWGGYGYFRDELYYIACSGRLDLGYVDQPPLSLYILAVSRALAGDSLFALRFVPALAGAATVFMTGRVARELGGGRFAQAAACLASIVSLIHLAVATIYSMNIFDLLFWIAAAWLVVRIVNTGERRYWMWLGIVLGLGLLNKIGVLWLGLGLGAGLLLTPHRRWLRTPSPWIAAGIALLIFLPYIIWNLTHGLAHLEFIRNATEGKYSGLTPLSFLAGQLLINNPVTVIVWLAGVFFLFFSRAGREFRLLGWMYLVPLVILLINGHSKAEYLAPAYGSLFAAGGVQLERWFSGARAAWLKPAALVFLALGLALAPVVLPVLPVETYIRYAETLGIAPATSEGHDLTELPQFYADMFGWEEKAQAVAAVFNTLTPEEQKKCVVYAENYGRCAAIDFFGPRYGLPSSIGNHNNYWIWGPRGYTGEVLLYIDGDVEDLKEHFESVEVAGYIRSRYGMPYENDLNIVICKKLRVPLEAMWGGMKNYN